MMPDKDEKLKAAYALNLWTVSISQIIDYNDKIVLEQEYNNIINNINLEKIIKDESLLEVIQEIMDEITNLRLDEGERLIADKQYQHRLKDAVWNAVPNVGAIFATSDPVAMGITLATQVGIGYMNYRRTKSEMQLEKEKEKWKIENNRMQHLHGLQKKLFETAWRLAEKYNYPDEYRLTENQITAYNQALMEANPVRRYYLLRSMRQYFSAYPHFWYQLGSTTNYVYRNAKNMGINAEDEKKYYTDAISFFKEYERINKHSILREDIITSSWALELSELDNAISSDNSRGLELIQTAVDYSGNSKDVLELCAFSYLRMSEIEKAIDIFNQLVNWKYNLEMNVQILSTLYIHQILHGSDSQKENAKFGYNNLKFIVDEEYQHYITNDTDLSNMQFEWKKDEDINAIIQKKEEEKARADEKKVQVRQFYSKPSRIIYSSELESIAIDLMGLMNYALTKYGFPQTSKRYNVDEYRKDTSINDGNSRIIFLGDFKETKPYTRSIGKNEWDYDKFGIQIKQFQDGNAVIHASSWGVNQIEFIDYIAKKTRSKWNLPPIKRMSSSEMKMAQYKLAIQEYLQLNDVLIIE